MPASAPRSRYADGSSEEQKSELARDADVIIAAGPAGRRLLTLDQLKGAKQVKVVTDVNAVPPSGVEGVGVNDDATPLPGTGAVAIGALTVGNVKYRTEVRTVQHDDRNGKASLSRLPGRLRSCPKARRLNAAPSS